MYKANAVVEWKKSGPGDSPVAVQTSHWYALLGARLNRRRQRGLPARALRISAWGCFLLLGLVDASLVMPVAPAKAAAGEPAKSANAKGQAPQPDGATSLDRPSVEITFAAPKRYAIITEPERKRQRLYEVGDVIVDPAHPSRTVKIHQIERRRLILTNSQTQRVVRVAVGESVPGFPDRRFTRVAGLTGVDYRYVATVAPLDPEPRLLSIYGQRAILEVDIRPPQSRAPRQGHRRSRARSIVSALDRKPDVAPFERVRVTETAPDTYDVSSAELKDALDHGGRVLAGQWPSVQPLLSMRGGIGLQVKSPVADGVFTAPGFQVTSPNLAGRFGIQTGDVILAINDQSMNSFGDLYNLYRQAVQSPLLSEVQVRLERRGVQLTKMYRIR